MAMNKELVLKDDVLNRILYCKESVSPDFDYDCFQFELEELYDDVKYMQSYIQKDLSNRLEERPAIKHGIWQSGRVLPTKTWHCSACKGVVETANYCYKCYYDYCPNCGAKNRR